MIPFKKILLGVFAFSFLSMNTYAETETWVVHTEKEFPPYNFTQQGEFTGLDTEIVELVLSELNVKPDYKFSAWDGVVQSVEENTTDLAFQFAPTPERFTKYNMVGPHRIGKTVISIPADSSDDIANVSDLNGKKVATVQGYSYLEEFDKSEAINKIESANNLESLKKLANKEVDFMIGDLNTILHLAKSNGLDGKIKVLPTVLKEVPRYIVFPKAKVADAKRFEAKLNELISNGKIDAIIQKWSAGS